MTAMQDPNPQVNGSGLALLRDAGIQVQSGILETEARRLNEAFITHKTDKRPFGIIKVAMTLDGKIATRTGESRWITSEESRAIVHQLRHRCDALVTAAAPFLPTIPSLPTAADALAGGHCCE